MLSLLSPSNITDRERAFDLSVGDRAGFHLKGLYVDFRVCDAVEFVFVDPRIKKAGRLELRGRTAAG